MTKSEKYVLSVEVYKYLYCGRPNKNEGYLSEKICCYSSSIGFPSACKAITWASSPSLIQA